MRNKKLLGITLVFAFLVSLSSFVMTANPTLAAEPAIPYTHDVANFNIVVLPDGRIAVSQAQLDSYNTTSNHFYIYSVTEDTIIYNYSDPDVITSYPGNVTFSILTFDIENNIATVSYDYDTEIWDPAFPPNVSTDPMADVDMTATYSNGAFTITTTADMTNFNLTDMIGMPFLMPGLDVDLSLSNGFITGQIRMLPDTFVATTVTINVAGNRTHIALSGSGGLNYQGEYFNWTHLEFAKLMFQNLTGPISQPGSMLNITNGTLSAPTATFNYVNHTGAPPPGANVDFELVIANTTTGILQSFLPMMLNSTIGDENVTAFFYYGIEKALNETSGSLAMDYDADALTIDVSATVSLDVDEVIDFMKEPIETSFWFPPWDVPPILNSDIPELLTIFQAVNASEVAFGHLNSFSASWNFDVAANWLNVTASAQFGGMDTILEDISDAMNSTMDFWWWNENVTLVDLHYEEAYGPTYDYRYHVETYEGGSQAVADYLYQAGYYDDSWVWNYLNNDWGYFNGTWRDNITWSFSNYHKEYGYAPEQGRFDLISGVILDIDPVFNDTWYDLDDFFSNWIASALAVNDTFSITVSGGSNGTHHTILDAGSALVAPDDTSNDPDGNLFVAHWDNVTLDNLTGLLFRPWDGGISGGYIDPGVIGPSNPFIMYDPYLGVKLEITNASEATAVTMGVATEPSAPGGGLTPVGFYVNITTEVNLTTVEGWITFYYTDAMVQALGLNEETLEVYWYNPATSSFEALSPVIRNTDENWVSGYLDHLSVFVLLGLPAGLPLWLILTIVGVVVVAALGVGFVMLRRRSVPTEGKMKTDSEGWKET